MTLMYDKSVNSGLGEYSGLQFDETSSTIASKPKDNLDSYTTSGMSSPFISNPDMLRDIGNQSYLSMNRNPKDGGFEENLQEIDDSINDLQRSLSRIKVMSNPEVSLESNQYDESHAQFDGDIDIDKSEISNRLISSGLSSTPWRKLRSSTSNSSNLPSGSNLSSTPNLKLSLGPMDTQLGTGSSNLNTINELNRQLTGYKIQIRFFKQFLQKIIENRNIDSDELYQFHNDLAGFSPSRKGYNNIDDYVKLDKDYKELSKSYDEIYKLNEDLYTSLEQFQTDLHEKETIVQQLTDVINEILETLIHDSLIDTSLKQALERCLANDDSLQLKLQMIHMGLQKRKESEKPLSFSSLTSTKLEPAELHQYLMLINQLMENLQQSETQAHNQKLLIAEIEQDLRNEIGRSQELKVNYNTIKQKFEALIQSTDVGLKNSNDMLKKENERLNDVNTTIMKKFDDYKQIIDNLQHEVDEFKELHNVTQVNEELLQSRKGFSKLQQTYNDLQTNYIKTKDELTNKITNLSHQLQSKPSDSSIKASFEKMEQELKSAGEKERTLKAEKIRLTYKVESLIKDKISKQTTIENLMDKVTSLTVSKDTQPSLEKEINVLEYKIKETLQVDLVKFQKLLESFNKIADDSSLKEPKRKIEYMAETLPNANNDLDTIREYHKSVFDYFTRAVEVVVNDHVKLLLQDNEETIKSSEYVNKLHKRIDELNKMNDELSKLNDTDDTISSPRSKLRLDELSNRWKAEREARVYENNEANRRLKELETENLKLRQQLNI